MVVSYGHGDYFIFEVVPVSISPSHKNLPGAQKPRCGVCLVAVGRGMTAPVAGGHLGDNRMGVDIVGIARSGRVWDRPALRRCGESILGKQKSRAES